MDGDCKVYYNYEIKYPNGKIKKSRKYLSKSFVKAEIQFLYIVLGYRLISIIDTGNATRDAYTQQYRPNVTAGVSNTNYGILLGTGDTAVSINDYKLDTKIATGSSAGQLQYGSQSYGSITVDGADCYFTLTRVFNNGSGGTITIKESGLACNANNLYFLLIRDVLGSPIDVVNGASLTFNYTIKITAS